MGAVHDEQRNEGKGTQEWYKMSLSDPNVISQLIKNRSRLDACYLLKKYATLNPFGTNGTPMFAEPIAVMYLDLDALIAKCRFNMTQLFIVKRMMLGYTEADIAYTLETTSSTIRKRLDRIISDIQAQNEADWRDYIETAGFAKIADDVRFKKCSKCGEFKRLDENNFAKDERNSDGFRAHCKRCR